MLAILYPSCYNVKGVAILFQTGVVKISKLASIRKAQGLTQERLSELSGVHRVLIARYESGRLTPTARNLVRLSNALNVPVDELIDKKAG